LTILPEDLFKACALKMVDVNQSQESPSSRR